MSISIHVGLNWIELDSIESTWYDTVSAPECLAAWDGHINMSSVHVGLDWIAAWYGHINMSSVHVGLDWIELNWIELKWCNRAMVDALRGTTLEDYTITGRLGKDPNRKQGSYEGAQSVVFGAKLKKRPDLGSFALKVCLIYLCRTESCFLWHSAFESTLALAFESTLALALALALTWHRLTLS